MDDFTKKDMEGALRAISLMISRTEKAKEKFEQGIYDIMLYIANTTLECHLKI